MIHSRMRRRCAERNSSVCITYVERHVCNLNHRELDKSHLSQEFQLPHCT